MKNRKIFKKGKDNLFKELTRIKNNAHPSEFIKAVNLLKNFGNNVISGKSDVKNLGFYKHPILYSSNIERELLWCCNLINNYKNEIEVHLKLKQKFQENVLIDRLDEAQSILDEMENRLGFSIWLINANLSLKQLSFGLVEQKNYLEKIYQDRGVDDNSDLLYYLLSLISHRNEPNINLTSLIRKLYEILDSLEDENSKHSLKILVTYFVFNEHYEYDEETTQYILSYTQSLSIYDLYEYVVYLISNAIFYNSIISNSTLKTSLKILSKIRDDRVITLSKCSLSAEALIGEVRQDPIIAKLAINCKDRIQIRNDTTGFQIKLASRLNCITAKEDSLIFDYLHHAKNIYECNNERANSIRWMNSFFANFRCLDITYHLLSAIEPIIASYDSNKLSFLGCVYSGEINYEILNYLNKEKTYTISDFYHITDDNLKDYSCYEKLIFDNNINEIEKIKVTGNNFINILYVKSKIDYLIKNERYDDVIAYGSSIYVENLNLKDVINVTDIFSNKEWRFYKSLNNFLDSTILLSIYLSKHNDDRQRAYLKQCWLSFMMSTKKLKPSDLTPEDFGNNYNKYIFFLKFICIPQIMEAEHRCYNSPRDITEERINICEILKEKIEDHDIENELKETINRLAISDGLELADSQGITVDIYGFIETAKNKFSDAYERYLLHFNTIKRNSPSLDLSENNIKKLIESFVSSPLIESDKILASLLNDLSTLFLNNHEFGLDYYLSMRIRHGRFHGVCRAPLEQRQLITKYSKDSNCYIENKFWLDCYSNILNESEKIFFNEILNNFSGSFDSIVNKFVSEKIQIRSENKPLGAFNIQITNFLINAIKHSLSGDGLTTFDDFLIFIYEYFIINIQRCSVEIKETLNESFKEEVQRLFINFQKDIHTLLENKTKPRGNNIFDELNRARADIDLAILDINGWFNVLRAHIQTIRPYSFENLINIALSRVSRAHNEFKPKININSNYDREIEYLASILTMIIDALSIALTNINQHSGYNSPEIDIDFNLFQDEYNSITLNIKISNPVTDDKVDNDNLKRIKNDLLESNQRSIEEGDSGFCKLRSLPILLTNDDLDFYFHKEKEQYMFTLNMNLTFDGYEKDEKN